MQDNHCISKLLYVFHLFLIAVGADNTYTRPNRLGACPYQPTKPTSNCLSIFFIFSFKSRKSSTLASVFFWFLRRGDLALDTGFAGDQPQPVLDAD